MQNRVTAFFYKSFQSLEIYTATGGNVDATSLDYKQPHRMLINRQSKNLIMIGVAFDVEKVGVTIIIKDSNL